MLQQVDVSFEVLSQLCWFSYCFELFTSLLGFKENRASVTNVPVSLRYIQILFLCNGEKARLCRPNILPLIC